MVVINKSLRPAQSKPVEEYMSTEPMWFHVSSNVMGGVSTVGLNNGNLTDVKLPSSYINGGNHSVPFRVTPNNLGFMQSRLEVIGYDFFFFVKNEATGDYTIVFEVKSMSDFNNVAPYLQNEIMTKGYADVFLNETMALGGDNGIALTSIQARAFKDLTQLKGSLTIPSSYKTIGSQAFHGCTGITSITLKATTPPTLSDTSAIPNSVTKIYIPEGTLGAYQSATNWSSLFNIFDDGTVNDPAGDDLGGDAGWNDGWGDDWGI